MVGVDHVGPTNGRDLEDREELVLKGPEFPPSEGSYFRSVYSRIIQNPEDVFLIEGETGKTWSYGELVSRARSWASWLRSRDLGPGHVVSLATENNLDGFAVWLGTWMSGAAANPFNFTLPTEMIRNMLLITMPDVVYCSAGADLVLPALRDLQTLVVTPGGTGPHLDSLEILSRDDEHFELPEETNSPTHLYQVSFTSGTTGLPKGVLVTDLVLRSYYTGRFFDTYPVIITSKAFWISTSFCLSATLAEKGSIVILKPDWTGEDFLKAVQTVKPASCMSGRGTMLSVSQTVSARGCDVSCVQRVVSGGDVLSAAFKKRINQTMFDDKLAIWSLYGSTEAGILTSWNCEIDFNGEDYESVGGLAPGVSIKVVDVDGRAVGPGQRGRLLAKAPWIGAERMTTGRRRVPLLEQGWLPMGDVASYSSKGLLRIFGRQESLIHHKGVQIAPGVVESKMEEHPEVKDCSMVARKHPVLGDAPVIFVVLIPGASTTVDQLRQYINANVDEADRPEEIYIIDSLPTTVSGKTIRSELEKIASRS